MTEEKQRKALVNIMFENKSKEARKQFANLLKNCLNETMMQEKDYLFDTQEYTCFNFKTPKVKKIVGISSATSHKSAACRFMKIFFSQLIEKEVRQNWRNYKEYFEIIKDFAMSSFEAARFMIQLGAIGQLLEFINNCMNNFTSVKPKMG